MHIFRPIKAIPCCSISPLIIAYLLLGTTTSMAEAPSSSDLKANSSKLEEVNVTAQKREQRLLDVPISVSVINRQQLTNSHISTLSNITGLIPNFQAGLPNGEVIPIFSIRGVSMADYSVNQSSPIGVYIDEVNLGANYTHGLSIFDLERIEVLRGPQGTLYGKNTTGGAINLISKTPDFEADGYIKLGVGNNNLRSAEGAYETPIIEQKLSARLAYTIEEADGYTDNHNPGKKDLSATDRHSARLVLNYQPTEQFAAILRLSTGRSSPEHQAIIPEISGPPANLFYERPSSYDSHDTDANKTGRTKVKTDGGSLSLTWETGDVIFTSVTGIYSGEFDQQADSDGTAMQILEVDYLSELDQWSQDFRVSSQQSEPFAYTAGLYFAKEEIDTNIIYDFFHVLRAFVPDFDPPNSGFSQGQHYEQEKESRAIYGQLSYKLSTSTTLTTGLRYTEDENSQSNVNTYMADYDRVPQFGLIPFNAPYDPNAVYPKQSFTDHEWTGTVKLDHHLNDNTMAYGSYSRGYRSGAFNGSAVADPAELAPVDPEYVNAYEIGVKGEQLNGRLQYSTALFYYDYRNQQFINIVGTQQLLDSAKRSRIQGAELELHALATDNLSLHFGLGIMDAEYTDGPFLDSQGETLDLSGNQLISAPDLNVNIAADYRIDLSHGTLNSHIDANYNDSQWFSAFNDAANYGDIGESSVTLINARLEYQPANSQLTIALWGKNIGDKEYKTYAINLSDSFGYNYTMSGAPRTYGAEVSLTF